MRGSTTLLVAVLAAATWLGSSAGADEPGFPVAPDLPEPSRQFDFWVGEWDVNLRTIQEDGSWKDTIAAEARIYPILEGKAVLELWDSQPIKGFSLRYFDPDEENWVLWLNWPGPDRSGSSSLEGSFRHGRGEFTSTRTDPEGNEILQVYTFSDVTPTSLRWDDAYSKDGGRTWSRQWIMKFSRTADVPTLAPGGGEEHTFETGARCGLDAFRPYETLAGAHAGTVETAGVVEAIRLTGYRVLDGCAVLLFLEWDGGERFAHLTYNTFASRYELLELDARPETPARILYGAARGGDIVFVAGEEGARTRVTLGVEAGERSWLEEAESAGGWAAVWDARFEGDGGDR